MSQRLRRSTARLTTDAVGRMATLPWFGALPPDERSFVGLVVQAGFSNFTTWLKDRDDAPSPRSRPRKPAGGTSPAFVAILASAADWPYSH